MENKIYLITKSICVCVICVICQEGQNQRTGLWQKFNSVDVSRPGDVKDGNTYRIELDPGVR